MSVQLLDKTRKINKLLHNSSSSKVVFNDICQVLMAFGTTGIMIGADCTIQGENISLDYIKTAVDAAHGYVK